MLGDLRRADHVDDRRGVEEGLEHDLPDRPHVAVAHEQRREQHRDAGAEEGEDPDERHQPHPVPRDRHALGEDEHEHGEEVHGEVERRREHHRKRDDHARELDLPHEVLAVDDRPHGTRRRLREEGVQDDVHQQHGGVEVHVLAEAEDVGEDQVQDPEQQQRPHELPQVAERRAEEAELPVGDRERARQVHEAAQVAVAEGGRALDPAAETRLDRCRLDGHEYAFALSVSPARSSSTSCAMSTSPPAAWMPVTITEPSRGRRSSTLLRSA